MVILLHCWQSVRKMKERGRKTLSKSACLKRLAKTGFSLVAFSMTIFESLQQAGVEVCCISPSAVMQFYKSFSDTDPLCNVGKIPSPVDKTPFKKEKVVRNILQYCKDNEDFLQNLAGLPLLLTQDNYLRAFSESDPRCLSQHAGILPCSPSIFVHSELLRGVFSSGDSRKASVFRPLDVDMFASHLHQTLPHFFLSGSRYVKWCPGGSNGSFPNLQWVSRVWKFLHEVVSYKIKKSDESDENGKSPSIYDQLSPLSEWCILPATMQVEKLQLSHCWETVTEHFLVPLKMAETVINFTDYGISSPKLVEVLRMLALPELHLAAVKVDSNHFVRNLMASLKEPRSLLRALEQKLRTASACFGKLKPSDAAVILGYFSSNMKSFTDDDKLLLRKLPLFPKTCGGLEKLGDSKGFVMSPSIPKVEIGVVQVRSRCLFLDSPGSSTDLYKLLKIKRLSSCHVFNI